MRLNSIIKISAPNFTKELFDEIAKLLELKFSHYQLELRTPYNFFESVPNPDYKPNAIPPDEEEILIYREAVCGCDLSLKKINHINFNIKLFLYGESLYIHPGCYYYANFNAANLKLFINYSIGYPARRAKPPYRPLTYKQWIDAHPDQKWAQHNYKFDKEDLAKIGIEV